MGVQFPLLSQVSGWSPLHRLVSGVQGEQLPALQTVLHAGPRFCQVPVLSHCCGCRPLQPSALGMQLPVQLPPLHTY